MGKRSAAENAAKDLEGRRRNARTRIAAGIDAQYDRREWAPTRDVVVMETIYRPPIAIVVAINANGTKIAIFASDRFWFLFIQHHSRDKPARYLLKRISWLSKQMDDDMWIISGPNAQSNKWRTIANFQWR